MTVGWSSASGPAVASDVRPWPWPCSGLKAKKRSLGLEGRGLGLGLEGRGLGLEGRGLGLGLMTSGGLGLGTSGLVNITEY